MPKRPLAVFTIVQHEPTFFPKWLRHYAGQVDPENIFVLHHELAGEEDRRWLYPADLDDYNIVPVRRDVSFDHDWLRDTVSAFQEFLLKSYEWVLFSEADELVLARPDGATTPDTLAELCDCLGVGMNTAVRPTGYEVVHDWPDEPPLDFDAPLWLPQRRRWYPAIVYTKPILASVPVRWDRGFHDIDRNAPQALQWHPLPADSELLLVHLHKIDLDYALARSRENAARVWARRDYAADWGIQNRIVDQDAMRAYFAKDEATGQFPQFEPIPDAIKEYV